MFVHIPWKNDVFKLRPHQVDAIERDAKGMFVKIRNANTGRLNKCRVVSHPGSPKTSPSSPKGSSKSPPKQPTLHDLVGRSLHGTIHRTGSDYVALLVDKIDGFSGSAYKLVSMAKAYMDLQKESWNVGTPRSWTFPGPGGVLGPHVSLHNLHMKDVGKRLSLRITGVMHWEENSRWVALKLQGNATDKHDWILHMSCAQQLL